MRRPLISSLCNSPYVTAVFQFLWFKQIYSPLLLQKYIPLHFDSHSFRLTVTDALHLTFLLEKTSFIISQDKNLSWTYTPVLRYTHAPVHVVAHAKSVSMNTLKSDVEMHTSPPTHFDLHTYCPHTHFPNNPWDKSLWDLPPCLQTASHTLPIHLSLDTQRCKNNTAALKKALGERRHGSQKHFCLFLMGHPHEAGRGICHKSTGRKHFKRLPWLTHSLPRTKLYCWMLNYPRNKDKLKQDYRQDYISCKSICSRRNLKQ